MPDNKSTGGTAEDLIQQENNSSKVDPITQMQAENAKLSEIYLTGRKMQASIDNIEKDTKAYQSLLKKQLEKMTQIYELLTRWSQLKEVSPKGEISPVSTDLTKESQVQLQESLNSQTSTLLDNIRSLSESFNNYQDFMKDFEESQIKHKDIDVAASQAYTITSNEAEAQAVIKELGPYINSMGDTLGSAIATGGNITGKLVQSSITDSLGPELSASLIPVLGPLAPVVGTVAGDLIAKKLAGAIEAAAKTIGEYVDTTTSIFNTKRDKMIEAAFEKYRQDLKAMATYQLDIYEQSVDKIYSAWDKNISQVNATQGYTKQQLNTLQDTVAQNLQKLGYENAINAADFSDSLISALNANLSGELAEVFATQSMILQKAIPEFNPASMAEQFAAVWTNAVKEGKVGEDVMTSAMEQIAGATRAIRESTEGNNQFIKQIPSYFTKAQEMVARADGSVEQVAELTTQMMAAEGPLAALAPQLSGFTGELVTILADQNNSSAVALRSIMHDMNSEIGVSATDFMRSFMSDTKGTLETAFDAIQSFLDKNMNPGAQQEFYEAMSSLFGISSDKLAQIDFGYISEQLSKIDANTSASALAQAEDLMASGETTTLEEQLVNNTANMLLAQNAVRDTLDNSLMRKLETNEIQMEKMLYATQSTQFVDFAQTTMQFFVKMRDIIMTLRDPFGITKALQSAGTVLTSAIATSDMYAKVKGMSRVGSSSVESNEAANSMTALNTLRGAQTLIKQAGDLYSTDTVAKLVSDTAKVSVRTQTIDEKGRVADKEVESLNSAVSVAESDYQQVLSETEQQVLQEAIENKKIQQENHESLLQTAGNTLQTVSGLTNIGSSITNLFGGVGNAVKGIGEWTTGWFKEQIDLSWIPITASVSSIEKNWDWYHTAQQPYITTMTNRTSTMNDNIKAVSTSVNAVKTSFDKPIGMLSEKSASQLEQLKSITSIISAIKTSQTSIAGDSKNAITQIGNQVQKLTEKYTDATTKNYDQLFYIQSSFNRWHETFGEWSESYKVNTKEQHTTSVATYNQLTDFKKQNKEENQLARELLSAAKEHLYQIYWKTDSLDENLKKTTGTDGILQKIWNDTQAVIGKGTPIGLPDIKSALEALGDKLDTIDTSIKSAAYDDTEVKTAIGSVTTAINNKDWTVVNNYYTTSSDGSEASQILNS